MLKAQLKKKIVMQEKVMEGFQSLVLDGEEIEARITQKINEESEDILMQGLEKKQPMQTPTKNLNISKVKSNPNRKFS